MTAVAVVVVVVATVATTLTATVAMTATTSAVATDATMTAATNVATTEATVKSAATKTVTTTAVATTAEIAMMATMAVSVMVVVRVVVKAVVKVALKAVKIVIATAVPVAAPAVPAAAATIASVTIATHLDPETPLPAVQATASQPEVRATECSATDVPANILRPCLIVGCVTNLTSYSITHGDRISACILLPSVVVYVPDLQSIILSFHLQDSMDRRKSFERYLLIRSFMRSFRLGRETK